MRFVSEQSSAILGVKPEELMADSGLILKRTAPADQQRLEQEVYRSAAYLKRYSVTFPMEVRGRLRSISVQAEPHREPGGTIVWDGHITDVTELAEAHATMERQRTLLSAAQEHAGIGFWDFDLATGKIAWSPEVFRIHGVDPDDGEPDYPRFRTLYHPDDLPALEAAVQRAASSGTPYRFDLRVIRPKTGEVRHVAASGGAMRSPGSGKVTALFGTLLDITDRKRVEQTMAAARDAAEAATKAKSDFLATMSHEVRTPLNGVIGMLGLLRATKLDEIQEDYCGTIEASAESLLAIVNDILEFSRLESGRLELESIPFSFNVIAREAMEITRPEAVRKGLSLNLDAQPMPAVIGDPVRLRQVLLNLLANAVKFTESGSVRVSTASSEAPGGRQGIDVVVEDTGIGISPEKQSRLFQRFSQADTSTTRRFGGSGLGLAICKSLIELMGGKIGVDSVEGAGSRFWFRIELPIHQGSLLTQPRKAGGLTRNFTNLRILVAEDSAVNQRLAQTILQRAGCEVRIARDGNEAVEMALSENFNLIFMDGHMPNLDGYGATRAIRARLGRLPPIIALTANALTSDRAICIEAGMDDCLTKPYRPDQLIDMVELWTSIGRGDACVWGPAPETSELQTT